MFDSAEELLGLAVLLLHVVPRDFPSHSPRVLFHPLLSQKQDSTHHDNVITLPCLSGNTWLTINQDSIVEK